MVNIRKLTLWDQRSLYLIVLIPSEWHPLQKSLAYKESLYDDEMEAPRQCTHVPPHHPDQRHKTQFHNQLYIILCL